MENSGILVDVKVRRNSSIVRERRENDPCDADDVEFTHHTLGWFRSKSGPYRIDDASKPVYVVYVEYESGDSFHREYGHREIMALNQDFSKAEENIRLLNEAKERNSYSVFLTLDDGTSFKIGVPGTAYFHRITNINYDVAYETSPNPY